MANSDAMYNATIKNTKVMSPTGKKLKNFLIKHPEYKNEFLELAYNGETLADIYNYLYNKELAKHNDKILTEMGL